MVSYLELSQQTSCSSHVPSLLSLSKSKEVRPGLLGGCQKVSLIDLPLFTSLWPTQSFIMFVLNIVMKYVINLLVLCSKM